MHQKTVKLVTAPERKIEFQLFRQIKLENLENSLAKLGGH